MVVTKPQIACDRCSIGVMDQDNPHLYGKCTCSCHNEALVMVTKTLVGAPDAECFMRSVDDFRTSFVRLVASGPCRLVKITIEVEGDEKLQVALFGLKRPEHPESEFILPLMPAKEGV